MTHMTRLAGALSSPSSSSSLSSLPTAQLARLLVVGLGVLPHGTRGRGLVLARRYLDAACNGLCSATAVVVARRGVHERPFQELPEDITQGEAYAVARDAVLQLNIMLRRGIEPDVLMYTSLIATMGRAGLEWQAYKLFSRMIEQNIRPLPETYVALRDATSKQRTALREQIQTKIEESVDVFPEELAEVERARQQEEDRRCIAKFEEYMRGVLPATSTASPPSPIATSNSAEEGGGDGSSGRAEGAPRASGIATMHIRSPTDAWNTTKMAQEQRGHAHVLAKGDSAVELRTALERLDEEELRIYLSAQRQLRHGSKAQLIGRILLTVSATAIHAMLARRAHYFRSVEQILAADLRQLNMSGPAAIPAAAAAASTEDGASSGSDGERDRTMRATEREAVAPEVLHAPWGILRKPMRSLSDALASTASTGVTNRRNAERLERVRLSEPELSLVAHKADTNDLDELPESLLRRYAYQFQLRWRRKDGTTSLLQAVQWHVTTYVARPADASEAGAAQLTSPPPTPAIRLQKEREGMQETLANYDAFRVIAQRTGNLQVVDGHEINRHLQRVRRDAAQRERRLETALRRERHVMAAAGLAISAKSFTPPPQEDTTVTQVLGIGEGGDDGEDTDAARLGAPHEGGTALIEAGGDPARKREAAGVEAEEEASASELPPWALFEEEDEFNLSSGHFGDPTLGRYQELSDSRVQLLPSRAAQARWSVDRQLLPSSLKDIVHEAELEQQRRHDAVEQEYERRLHYTKYRKWDKMIARAQERKRGHTTASGGEDADEDSAEAVRPLPAKRRLAQLLRKGKDRERLSPAVQTKYSRSL